MSRVICAATALAFAFSLAVPAAAHDKAFDSRITINHPSPPTYRGRVFSESPGCVADRRVKVYTEEGEYIGDASERTDEQGRWQFDFAGNYYYAKVTREVRGGAGHQHVCRADKSRTI